MTTRIKSLDETGAFVEDADLGYHYEADSEDVEFVLAQSTDDFDGRSEWKWIRLADGTLILGVFPQGDTYFALERTFK